MPFEYGKSSAMRIKTVRRIDNANVYSTATNIVYIFTAAADWIRMYNTYVDLIATSIVYVCTEVGGLKCVTCARTTV